MRRERERGEIHSPQLTYTREPRHSLHQRLLPWKKENVKEYHRQLMRKELTFSREHNRDLSLAYNCREIMMKLSRVKEKELGLDRRETGGAVNTYQGILFLK